MSDYVPLTEHAELELRAEIERLRAVIDGYSRTGYTVMRAQLTEAAAFLDRMAERIDGALHISVVADDAASCRAMAKRLRGEELLDTSHVDEQD